MKRRKTMLKKGLEERERKRERGVQKECRKKC